MEYYAHSRNAQGHRHDFLDHVYGVTDLAVEYASAFDAAELARLLGLWHDLGKLNPAFQEYLLRCEQDPTHKGHGPDHKATGATLALQHAQFLAVLIQGHHGGLKTRDLLKQWLREKSATVPVSELLELSRQLIPNLEPGQRVNLPPHVQRSPHAAEFFLRMLFSALVDADYLDTERHFNADKSTRRGTTVSIADLWQRFEQDQARYASSPTTLVNDARAAIYDACLAAADQPQGLFRLTVPTGGGKTRSGMAFALRHALKHDLHRVIVAVPFITITEQTTDVYRRIFNRAEDMFPAVLEHHSASGRSDDSEAGDFHPDQVWARLAAENWDAPIVVTTTVQLFESLFAASTGQTRKLHRLARSVIILDEAQALPAHLLTPILDALQELTAHYYTTVVLSTATQPAFQVIRRFTDLRSTEIIPEPERWFATLKRVDYEWLTDRGLAWTEVAAMLREQPQSLAVVNTKKDALTLLDALGDSDALHLSTLLCGAHRRQVIGEVKRRLKAGEPCRLVSTQVIEAGVDLDFPVVFRALGPLDGIIQAAGRCNREGHLDRGRVIVFRPYEGSLPQGAYKAGAGITETLRTAARHTGKELDPNDPAVSASYFERLFPALDTDREGIQKLREQFLYPDVDHAFKMIKDDTISVVVAYGNKEKQEEVTRLLDRLRAKDPAVRFLLRRLQPYLVSIRRRDAERYERQGFVSPILPGLGEWHGKYDDQRGLTVADNFDFVVG